MWKHAADSHASAALYVCNCVETDSCVSVLRVYVSECFDLSVCGSSSLFFWHQWSQTTTTASSMGHHNHMRPAFPRGGAKESTSSELGRYRGNPNRERD